MDQISLEKPNKEGNVWPEQYCPAFCLREGITADLKGCWYCKYADFHLNRERALDVGVCYFPRKID
ncbi:MAG: hypothetical protein RR428_00305 [Coprobacillus sp.]